MSEPRRECYQETRYNEPRYESVRAGGPAPAAGSMILGGLILGSTSATQIGHGDGRRAATVAGALIGSALGHDAAARNPRDGRYEEVRLRRPGVHGGALRRALPGELGGAGGDRVAYEYNGRRYETRLPYDPGERVRVRVDVFPRRVGTPPGLPRPVRCDYNRHAPAGERHEHPQLHR